MIDMITLRRRGRGVEVEVDDLLVFAGEEFFLAKGW